eukprot:Sspe_Gene.58211::Locus_31930_Transcript_3_4_Confidence_0.625_Length_397::g.58211::m.58211
MLRGIFHCNVQMVIVGGRTPLHTAAEEGDADCVERLLAAGADKRARDNGGATPMDLALHVGVWKSDNADRLLSLLQEDHRSPERPTKAASAEWVQGQEKR